MAEPSFRRVTTVAPRSVEDRLTEILALCLNLDRGLLEAFRSFGIEPLPTKVRTQQPAHTEERPHDRVDLALESKKSTVWIEAKVDSGEGDMQLERYACALDKTSATEEKHLIYLTRPGGSEAAIAALKKTHGSLGVEFHAWDWSLLLRELLATGSSPTLKALAKYMREEGVAVEPLRDTDINALKKIDSTRASLWTVFNSAREILDANLDGWERAKEDPKKPDGWPLFPFCHVNFFPSGRLDEDLRPRINFELCFSSSLDNDRPGFFAGLTIPDGQEGPLELDALAELLEELDLVPPDPGDSHFRFVRRLDLDNREAREQGARLAEEAAAIFRRVMEDEAFTRWSRLAPEAPD